MKKVMQLAMLIVCGMWLGSCAAPKSTSAKTIDCNSVSIQEIQTIMGAKFLAPEVTKPELLGSDAVECNWFRKGERGWVTVLTMSVSTRESRLKEGAAVGGQQHLGLLRWFLVRNGQRIALGDETWVNWVDVTGGMGNGVLVFRKQDTVVSFIISDQDDLAPNVKELTAFGKILEGKL